MKASLTVLAIALCCCATTATATDLNLSLTDDLGQSSVSVAPGATVNVAINGELSDALSEGLALFGVDMSVSGPVAVDLSTAASISAPSPSMDNFVSPNGLNNPTGCAGCFGFGGTANVNDLLQIGGGANTIGNDILNAPFPIGTVDLGIAQNGAPMDLAIGTVTMPATAGIYTISLPNGFANVIQLGQTVGPVYATQAAALVTTSPLVVTVTAAPAPLIASVLSINNHGGTPLSLDVFSGNNVEPRLSGITTLEVGFDMAMDPLTVVPANVSAVGNSSGAYAGTISTVLNGTNDVLTITFDTGPLADVDCHTMDLTGMQSSGGQGLGNPSFVVTGLAGDVDRDRTVTTVDASLIKPHFNETASTAGAEFDVDGDGTVTTVDFSTVKPRFNNAPGC